MKGRGIPVGPRVITRPHALPLLGEMAVSHLSQARKGCSKSQQVGSRSGI